MPDDKKNHVGKKKPRVPVKQPSMSVHIFNDHLIVEFGKKVHVPGTKPTKPPKRG